MTVKLLFFAQCADWMGRREIDLTVDSPVAIVDALDGRPEFAVLRDRRAHLRVAVNCAFADFNTEVHDGDEVAFLPPFSGG